MCVVIGCRRGIDEDDDLGVCGACAWRIAQRYKVRILAEDRAVQERHRERWRAAQQDKRTRDATAALYEDFTQPVGTSFVYYVRIGDHIKIGYSSRVRSRLQALRVPVDNLLALEPGGRDEEVARHRQFAAHRITQRWENFHPTPELMAHIDALRQEYGLPKWLRSPRRGKNGPVEVRRA